MSPTVRSILREPLLHFLLLGAAFFGVHRAISGESAPHAERIVIDAGQIEHMAAVFARFHQRPPSPDELKGLIDQRVQEEVLSREAVRLGLDRDDAVIRRRLQQKLEFIASDLAAADEPTDADLTAWLADHPDRFRLDQRISFRHVYFDSDRRGDRLSGDAAAALAALRDGRADAATLGDGFLLPSEFTGEPGAAIAAQFGPEFAAALAEVSPGAWTGPVRSGFGAHLVLVTSRTDGRAGDLPEVRDAVRRDLINHRRVEANRRFLDDAAARYEVRVLWPVPDPDTAATPTP